MSNINPAGEYNPFGLKITTINGNNEAAKDIINSSQTKPEGGVNDGYGDGDDLFD